MAAAVEKVVNGHHQIIIVLISFWMAVGRRQPGVGLSHPEVDLPPEQHLLLLLRFPDGPHSGREISGRLSPDHLQTDHRLEDKKWKVVFFFFKNAWDKFYLIDYCSTCYRSFFSVLASISRNSSKLKLWPLQYLLRTGRPCRGTI